MTRCSGGGEQQVNGRGAKRRRSGRTPTNARRLAVDDPLVEAGLGVRLERSRRTAALPGVIRLQFPAHDVVGKEEVEHGVDPLLVFGVLDRHEDLDAAVEVARHQVGRADEVQLLIVDIAVGEVVDPTVLEVAPEDAAYADVARKAQEPPPAATRYRG